MCDVCGLDVVHGKSTSAVMCLRGGEEAGTPPPMFSNVPVMLCLFAQGYSWMSSRLPNVLCSWERVPWLLEHQNLRGPNFLIPSPQVYSFR